MTTLTYYDLDELGIIGKFGIALTDKTNYKWEDIIVIDSSGSMGGVSKVLVREILPLVYKDLGVKDHEEIHVIGFDAKTKHSKVCLDKLEQVKVWSNQLTFMEDAVEKVKDILVKSPRVAYRIVVASDGEINDKGRVLEIAKRLPDLLSERGAPILVLQLRLFTHRNACPDVVAMTCLGQLDSWGNIAIESLKCDQEDLRKGSFVDKVRLMASRHFNCSKRPMTEISVGESGGNILRLPFSKPLSSTPVQIEKGNTKKNILFSPGTDMEKLALNSYLIDPSNVTKGKDLRENDFQDFLGYVHNQIKQLIILGHRKKATDIAQWVKKLNEKITKPRELVVEGDAASTKFRRRKLVKENPPKEIFKSIEELVNIDRVNQMNSDMKADFLMGIHSGSEGRALAKRAQRMDQGVDSLREVVTEAEILRSILESKPLEPAREELCSFYSHDTFPDCLNGLTELDDVHISELSHTDIMQFVGPIGLSFRARSTDAPDPFSCLLVEKVFAGDSYVLNSSDLWSWRMQRKVDKFEIKAPGTDELISGVLPVRSINPDAYDLMVKNTPNLFKLHIAASLRGSLVSMPGDLGALLTSCALKLCLQLSDNYNESTAVSLIWLIKDLRYWAKEKVNELGIKPEILKGINEGDPKIYLAGDLSIASENKPLGGVLAGTISATPELARATLGYMCYLAAHKKVVGPEEKKKAVRKVLGIRKINELPPGDIFTSDPDWKFYDQVDLSRLHQAGGTFPLRLISSVYAAFESFEKHGGDAKSFGGEFCRILKEEGEVGIVPRFFGFEGVERSKNFAGASALQGLLSPNLSCRVEVDESGVRTFVLPDLDTPDSIIQYVKEQVSNWYEDLHKKALKKKRAEEINKWGEALVIELCETSTVEKFIELLHRNIHYYNNLIDRNIALQFEEENHPVIFDRTEENFAWLCKRLLSMDKNFNLVTDKLWVLILGRDLKLQPVWLLGNCLKGHLYKFSDYFVGCGLGEKWTKIRNALKLYGEHTYRAAGIANRHGHSKDFPSWWALGFKSLEEYQQKKPEESSVYVQRKLEMGHLFAYKNFKGSQPPPQAIKRSTSVLCNTNSIMEMALNVKKLDH